MWACSSVVEHCVDIAGVASSILATPTIKKARKSLDFQAFFVAEFSGNRNKLERDSPHIWAYLPDVLGRYWACIIYRAHRLLVLKINFWLICWRVAPHSLAIGEAGPNMFLETWRTRVLSQIWVLGWELVYADLWVSIMSKTKEPTQLLPSRRLGVVNVATAGDRKIIQSRVLDGRVDLSSLGYKNVLGIHSTLKSRDYQNGMLLSASLRTEAIDDQRFAHNSGAEINNSADLLTPEMMIRRLKIDSTQPSRWIRKTFIDFGISFVNVRGKLRATESQFVKLLEAMQCSHSEKEAKTTITISAGQSHLVRSGSKSQNSVRERITRMRHAT